MHKAVFISIINCKVDDKSEVVSSQIFVLSWHYHQNLEVATGGVL